MQNHAAHPLAEDLGLKVRLFTFGLEELQYSECSKGQNI